MKIICKRVLAAFLTIITVLSCINNISALASWSEYSSWSGWSAWQDEAVSETDLRDVETRQVFVNTTYHYFRYSNQYSGGYGSYVYSSSYPTYYTYDFTSELEYTGTAGGFNKYKWWYSSSNYVSVYGASPYTTDNYKTQYRYRTRSLINYYTVSYNANGGSGAPSSQTKVQGTSLTLSNTIPTKKYTLTFNPNGGNIQSSSTYLSCNFINWRASNGAVYNKGGSYTSDSDTTMTAQWTNPTAGTLPTPTRTGYTFKGWYSAASGGTQVTSSTSITSDTIIYAQWTANSYSVRYNGNGYDSGSMSNSSHTYGAFSSLSLNVFRKEGYTFSKWNTKADGSGTAYSDGMMVENLSSTNGAIVDLYAQWTQNTYSIKYDGNGSTEGIMSDSVHLYDTAASLSKNEYVKTHYLFNGWNTKADGSGDSFTDSETVLNLTSIANDTVTLYAQWSINEYSVFYHANGGQNAPKTQTKMHNEELIITGNCPEVPKQYSLTFDSKGGSVVDNKTVNCSFVGWNTMRDGTGVAYVEGDIYSNNETVMLYAQWSNPTAGTLSTPVKSGYRFSGWDGRFLNEDSTWGEWISISSSTVITGDAELLADWDANTYTISFDSNGGTCSLESKVVTFASSYGDLPIPVRAGFEFVGWFTDRTNGMRINKESIVDNPNDITLFAQWEEKSISHIAIDFSQTKTVYFVGDIFDPTQVTLIVSYEDGETQYISSGFVCSEPTLNKISQKRVTVMYGDHTTYFTVFIVNDSLSRISLESLPFKTKYSVGEELSTEGLTLMAYYNNGYVQEITTGYDVSYDFSSSGNKEVMVFYTEGDTTVNTSFDVLVTAIPNLFSDVSTAHCGELLSIPIYISDNSSIMGFGLEIAYNDNVFTPVSVEKSPLISGSFDDSIDTSNDNKFLIYWTGSEDVSEDGLLFTMNFEVSDNAHGNYNIKIDYLPDDTFNEDWDPVILLCSDVSINIIGGDETTPTVFADNITLETGSIFELPINITNNSGFTDVELQLSYDSAAFSPTLVSSGLSSVTNYSVDSSNGKLIIRFTVIEESAGDGVLCTVKFKSAYCDIGEYTISLDCSDGINCFDTKVNVINGPAMLYFDGIEVVDDVVTVPVYISGNKGLMGIRLNFAYDSTILHPLSANAGSIISSGMVEDTIGVSDDGVFSVIWIGNDDILADGELFVLRFDLLDASDEETVISVSYEQEDTYDSDWKDVVLLCDDANVVLKNHCEHINTSIINQKESTCIEKGYTGDTVCSDCGTILLKGNEIELTEHQYVSVVTPPTATDQGYTTHTCTICGNTFIDSYTDIIDPDSPQIIIASKKAIAGKTVDVAISLKNNPGITAMRIFVEYDSDVMTLKNVANKNLLSNMSASFSPSLNSNPYQMQWSSGIVDIADDGVFVVLTFEVSEDTAVGEYSINISYNENDIFNTEFDNVGFDIVAGSISVVRAMPGDVNGDDVVNLKDVALLQQYLSGWNVTIVEEASDTNADGTINLKDVALLQQYLSGWPVILR